MFLLSCWVVAQFSLEDKTRPFCRAQGRCEAWVSLLRRLVLQRTNLFQRRGTSTHPVKGGEEDK